MSFSGAPFGLRLQHLGRNFSTIAMMDERNLNDQQADAINDQMAAQIERRRREMPDQRRRAGPRTTERRQICSYCFQRGDHPTAAHCMRALERSDRIVNDDGV
jgi:hypothetical protein